MRFVVAQMGARRGYAVPVLLEQSGLLERFYTDVAGNFGSGQWLVQFGRLCGMRRAADKLASRLIPDSIKASTVTFLHPSDWLFSIVKCLRPNPAAKFRQQLRMSKRLGEAMARHGFGRATHFYSMLGECSPLLAAAKSARLTTVTEFYILLSTERIVSREQRAFPDWEPPPPDFEAIRSEFPLEQRVVANTHCAVCPSDAVQSDLESNFGFAQGRSAVVPYGVDAKWLELQPGPQRGRILFVGTAGLRKGIHYFAEAAQQLIQRGHQYEFRVTGEVTRRVLRQPSCRWVKFLGRVARTRVQGEFASADVLVLPSLAEGSAEATYEAVATGLPVITTAAAGSVVRDGIEGFIVPERDSAALANAIEQVVENRQLRTRLSQAARIRAADYTFERYGSRLVAALESFQV